MSSGVTVVIPHIPPRANLLQRAIGSVLEQTLPVETIIVVTDHGKEGAGPTRTRGLGLVDTEWVAFLDDDDVIYPTHLATLMQAADESGADVIVPWFDTNGFDPFPQHRGKPYDLAEHHTFPITTLVRTSATVGCRFPPAVNVWCSGDDEAFWQQLAARGGRIHSIPDITWFWDHQPPGGNTSGSPARW